MRFTPIANAYFCFHALTQYCCGLLALAGLLTIATVLLLIISRKASPLVALVAVPTLASLFSGFGMRTATFILKGMQGVAPVAAMFIFAILYFGIVTDAGMLDPVVDRILKIVGSRPSCMARNRGDTSVPEHG